MDLSTVPFYWSNRPKDVQQDYVPKAYAEAEYLINLANLKAHTGAGVTLCAKNHFGSFFRAPPEKGYYDMHKSSFSKGSKEYRDLVDMTGHSHIGGKTVLYLLDGLYGGIHYAERLPRKFQSAPFNGDWTSSLFASQDPVAIDSVGLDFLQAEPAAQKYSCMPGTEDYLHEAALANDPPSGTYYDPDHATNTVRLASLGVHEHWNNPSDKQYSRNLGKNEGIELVKASSDATKPSSVVVPGEKARLLAGGFKFTEGPAADAEGNVFFTDQPNDRICKWSVDGKLTDFMKPCGRSNGMFFDREGNLWACADMNNELWKIDPQGKVTVVVKDYDGKLLNGPNDLWIAPNGAIYFTDPLYKRDYWTRDPAMQQDGQHVYYLSPDHKTAHARRHRPDPAQRHHRHPRRQAPLCGRHRGQEDVSLHDQRRWDALRQNALLLDGLRRHDHRQRGQRLPDRQRRHRLQPRGQADRPDSDQQRLDGERHLRRQRPGRALHHRQRRHLRCKDASPRRVLRGKSKCDIRNHQVLSAMRTPDLSVECMLLSDF